MSQIVKSGARPTEMRQRGIQPQGMKRAHSLERRIPIAPLPGQFHIHGRRFNANRLAPHFLSHPARRARANERIENDSTFRASERNRIFHKILGKGSIVVFAAVLIFREDIPDIGYQCAIPLELYKVDPFSASSFSPADDPVEFLWAVRISPRKTMLKSDTLPHSTRCSILARAAYAFDFSESVSLVERSTFLR